ncbi:DUF2274 domain-containing protein [Rhizobium giardinii]|uniref:DUF2274 domain-containing protein n=1 Tax=Rhizobium giardinii TaxID=56731 RepID=UPI000DDAA7F0
MTLPQCDTAKSPTRRAVRLASAKAALSSSAAVPATRRHRPAGCAFASKANSRPASSGNTYGAKQDVFPDKLGWAKIIPMIQRFMATDRGFSRARRSS